LSNPEAINDTKPVPAPESMSQPFTPAVESQPVTEATPAPRSQDAGTAVPHTPPAAPPRQPYVSREERDRRRKEAIASLVIGEWREGKVTGIAQFGAFVDLGGVDGLVHVSQLGTGGYVERVEDVVQVGQVVRVRVVDVDLERGRVGLSMREPRATSAPPRDKPASAAPRPPRPAGVGFPPPITESLPEPRHDRRSRSGGGGGGGERPSFGGGRDERPARRSERPRRHRENEDEEWRTLRGDPRGYISSGDEPDEEPMPTTAEELVARFGRRGTNR